jgi:Tol biopolymer transport system component
MELSKPLQSALTSRGRKAMRSFARKAAMLLVFVSAGMSHAAEDMTRFSGELVLGAGKPVMQVRKFEATAGPATLKLYNGSGRCSWWKRVSGAWISINGDRVFSPCKVNERVRYLKATVTLKEGCNVLKVCLRGKPGAKIRIKIAQRMETCGPSRVSVASDGTQGNSESGKTTFRPPISADGRFVAFRSVASNLVSGDTNNQSDIFVHDRQTGVTERVSVASDGTQSNGDSGDPSISGDGRYVAFESGASNLVPDDNNAETDIFVHDRQTGVTERVSVASDGTQSNSGSENPSVSGDGRFVAYFSWASNLVPGDTNIWEDVFVHDRQTGVTELVSVAADGTQADNDACVFPSISSDGRYVAFTSAASLVPGDANHHSDVFVHDRETRMTELVTIASDGTQGNDHSRYSSISGDGRYVAFESAASNLVPGDANGSWSDVFVHDRETGVTERVSVATDGIQFDGRSGNPTISGDGRFVVYWVDASQLVPDDPPGWNDSFVHDRETGVTERVNVTADGTRGNAGSSFPSISGNGRFVAFPSEASNLVRGDTNGVSDVFVTCNPLAQQGRP